MSNAYSEQLQRHLDAQKAIPVLKWSETVGKRLEPAELFSGPALVMTEMDARVMVLEVLRRYGIQPETEE
jgi:hypothetical protein